MYGYMLYQNSTYSCLCLCLSVCMCVCANVCMCVLSRYTHTFGYDILFDSIQWFTMSYVSSLQNTCTLRTKITHTHTHTHTHTDDLGKTSFCFYLTLHLFQCNLRILRVAVSPSLSISTSMSPSLSKMNDSDYKRCRRRSSVSDNRACVWSIMWMKLMEHPTPMRPWRHFTIGPRKKSLMITTMTMPVETGRRRCQYSIAACDQCPRRRWFHLYGFIYFSCYRLKNRESRDFSYHGYTTSINGIIGLLNCDFSSDRGGKVVRKYGKWENKKTH